ncbi:hypothetical protein PPERSA_01966 [Pseudocohnilembus persalinus]|uniref:Uncharacterized protein n=1 Tax=Pseudocohnilembus persalinus TaxID=266149 RepID=A0A0V0R3N2_PSEPJ|nr:hypothetical protein PPERSA_01966 [Pseudocohnilembus persalinus]|eukprot:KRX09079.1 hypothetical protein PPERSA_01966 [Pseudocohnilembus persalinus]
MGMDGKDILSLTKSPQELQQMRQEQSKRKYEQLLEKIEFFEHDQYQRTYKYNQGLMPWIYFWKALARKPEGSKQQQMSTINRLKLWIPDTIVISDEDLPPMWFYTSPEGYVYRTDTFTTRHISAKLSNYASPDELVAVFKKQSLYEDGEICGNEVKMSSARELFQMTAGVFQEQAGTQVIQKFVKANGPKAFICRTCWRKGQNPYSWIITNKSDFYPNDNIPNYSSKKGQLKDSQKYLVQPRQMGSATIVYTCRGNFVEQTVPYIQNILRYLDIQIKVRFKEFIADFIKDESGIWWMINVKGFKLDDTVSIVDLKPITNYGDYTLNRNYDQIDNQNKYSHTKMKICKYCERSLPENELNHKMTLKMIIQTDRHLLHRSKGGQYQWLERSDLNSIDLGILYQYHKVCVLCYKIYTEVEKLINIEYEFAQKLGIPCSTDTKYKMLNLQLDESESGKQQGIKEMYKGVHNQKDIPPSWQMDIRDNGRLIMENYQPRVQYQVEKKLYRYRLLIMFDNLMEIPDNIDFTKNYYIQYELFGQTVKYKLDFSDAKYMTNTKNEKRRIQINIDKIRQFYFFAKGQKIIEDDINQKKQKKYENQGNIQNQKEEEEEYDKGRQALNKFYSYRENEHFLIKLVQDNYELGVIKLDFQDLVTESSIKKEYYRFFDIKEKIPQWGIWGLNMTLSLVNGGIQDVSRIQLDDIQGIYLPDKDYYASDPLPPEWIQMIKDRPDPSFKPYKKKDPSRLLMYKTLGLSSSKKNLSISGLSPAQSPKKTQFSKTQSESNFNSLQNKGKLNNHKKYFQNQLELKKDISPINSSQNKLKLQLHSQYNFQETPGSKFATTNNNSNYNNASAFKFNIQNTGPKSAFKDQAKKEVKFDYLQDDNNTLQDQGSYEQENNTTLKQQMLEHEETADVSTQLQNFLQKDLNNYEKDIHNKKKPKRKIYY